MSIGEMSGEFGVIPDRFRSDPDEYIRMRRKILWSLPTGLYLLGTHKGESVHVMTTSWIIQVATRPKIVACSIEQGSKTLDFVLESQNLSVSLVSKTDRSVIRKYVKKDQDVTLHGSDVIIEGNQFLLTELGNPYLASCVGYFEANLVNVEEFESHAMIFAEIFDCNLAGDPKDVLSNSDTLMNYGG